MILTVLCSTRGLFGRCYLRPAGLYHASETGTNFNVISNTDSPDFALASILYADFREIIPRNLQTLKLTYGYRGESLPPWE
jgi:hypothetical protein